MKTLATFGLAISALWSPLAAQKKEPDRWLGQDKLKHFFMAGYSYSVTHAALQAASVSTSGQRNGGLVISVSVSVGKEVADRRRGSYVSYRDLAWDGAGIALAALLMNSVKR